MMKKLLLISTVFFSLLICSGQSTDQEIEAEKIKQVWYNMGEALIDKNWDEYQNFWVRDSTVNALHPSEPDWAKGWQALQKRYKAICESDIDMSDVNMPKADIFEVHIAPGGEFAWALIEQRMFRAEEQFYHSWYMLVYKKINGKWLVNAILDANVPPQISD